MNGHEVGVLVVVSPREQASAAQTHARGVIDGPEAGKGVRVECSGCERRLAQTTKHARPRMLFVEGVRALDDRDWCRWCARPISERAEQLVPREGFVNLARALLGERTPARAS